jgi:hypothetical protein
MDKPIEIYIDADACPVKEEVYRVPSRAQGLRRRQQPDCGAARAVD